MRISYTKADDNGSRESREWFSIGNEKLVKVLINTNEGVFKIVASDNVPLVEGNAKSYQLLLRQVKKTLKELGVDLGTETRVRK